MRLANIDGQLETLIAAPASNSTGQDVESAVLVWTPCTESVQFLVII